MENNNIFEKFYRQALLSPERIAIYHFDGNVTYQELLVMSKKIALYLLNLKGHQPIAIKMKRSPWLIASLLGCLAAGRTYVPIDPTHPPDRIDLIIKKSQPDFILTDQTVYDLIESKEHSFDAPLSKHQTDIAYILYTSGSTGIPKGIEILTSAVYSFIQWAEIFYSQAALACVLASTTITFDLSVFEILIPLSLGKSLFLVNSAFDLLEPKQSYELITLINTVPTAIKALIKAQAIPSSVQVINLAGEALDWDTVDKLYALNHVSDVYNLWGPSEDTTYSSVYRCPSFIQSPIRSKDVPIGKAIAGTEISVRDQYLQPVKSGAIGEICLSGKKLAKGYCSDLELTNQKFVNLKEEITGAKIRVYRTGDLGFIDNEQILHFTGRLDLQVKVNGYRIELEEIENAALDLEEIEEAIAITLFQADQCQLALGIKLKNIWKPEDQHQKIVSIKQALSKTLPFYMIPNIIWLTNEQLPQTPNGKRCRNTLEKKIRENLNLFKMPGISDGLVNFIFSLLSLKVDPKLGFKTAGGNSIQALRLINQLNKHVEHQIQLKDLLLKNTPIECLEKLIVKPKKQNWDQSNNQYLINLSKITLPEKRMWTVYQSTSHPSAYNISLKFEIVGDLILNRIILAVKRAINEAINLNQNYFSSGEQVYKEFNHADFELIQVDPQEEDIKIDDLIFNKPFSLESEKLVRGSITELTPRKYLLRLCFPHVVIDGLGIDNLLKCISHYYASTTPFLVRNDTDYLAYEKSLLNSEKYKKALEYWKNKMDAAVQPFNWPPMLRSSSVANHVGFFKLTKDELKNIYTAVSQLNISEPILLMGSFSILLYVLKLNSNPIISIPLGNRSAPENYDLISNLINTVPFVKKIDRHLTLKQYLSEIYSDFMELLEFEEISFSHILEVLREDIKEPEQLFDTIFSYMDFANQLKIANCEISREFFTQSHCKSKLVLSAIKEDDGSIILKLEADAKYVNSDLAYTLITCYEYLIRNLASFLNQAISDIAILPPEQKKLIEDNLNYQAYLAQESSNDTIIERIAKMTALHSERPCVVDGENIYNYQEIWQQAQCVAQYILQNNIPIQSGIGLSLKRSWRIIPAIIGVLYTNCYYVPLDPKNPRVRNLFIQENSELKIIIDDDLFDRIIQDPVDLACRESNLLSLVYIIYTSGTTGQPKGVPITNKNILSLFDSCQKWANFSEKDVWALFHSYAFDFSVWEIFGGLLYGGKIVILNEKECINAVQLSDIFEKNQISIFNQTPTSFKNLLVTNLKVPNSVRMLIFGGEALNPYDLKKWWQQNQLSKTKLINMYGITEITVHATQTEVTSSTVSSNIGYPLADMGMVVVDNEGKPCPVGIPGEIWLAGEGVCQGYWKNEENNLKKFIYQSFYSKKKEKFYKSGDLAILTRNGSFEYIGRSDNQIKINGHRLEKSEVILALRKIDGVKDAYIKVVTSECGLQYLIGYYLSTMPIPEKIIVDALAQSLPYYAIPSVYIRLDKFPLTVNGKIDVEQLPLESFQGSFQSKTEQVDQVENNIVEAWCEVLGCQTVVRTKSFFEHGGNSIKAVLLTKKINGFFAKKSHSAVFSIVDIFRYPTIEKQSNFIKQKIDKGAECPEAMI